MADLDPGKVAQARRRLVDGALGAFLLLALQGAAGIYLNLYVPISATNDYGTVFTAMFGSAAGILHFLFALGLFLGGITMIVSAFRTGDGRFQFLTVLAFLLLIVAAYSGYHFIYAGDAAYSFSMELAFLGIVLCEGAILALVARTRPSAAAEPTAPVSSPVT